MFLLSVQKLLLLVRAFKIPRLKGVGIGPRTETCVNWGGPITMVPCLRQGNIYIKRKLQAWRDQKCIPLLGAKAPLTCAGHQTTPSQCSLYRPENGSLRKFGWTYRHGTVFAPRQCLYSKGSYGHCETRNVFPWLVQKPLLLVSVIKLPCL